MTIQSINNPGSHDSGLFFRDGVGVKQASFSAALPGISQTINLHAIIQFVTPAQAALCMSIDKRMHEERLLLFQGSDLLDITLDMLSTGCEPGAQL
ncbi:MAG: hypothetical protein CMJ19_11940 [Phycisphaeraceae bacterium]|nr:hypothetical protein [Phycisphaeraceae bacterium]